MAKKISKYKFLLILGFVVSFILWQYFIFRGNVSFQQEAALPTLFGGSCKMECPLGTRCTGIGTGGNTLGIVNVCAAWLSPLFQILGL